MMVLAETSLTRLALRTIMGFVMGFSPTPGRELAEYILVPGQTNENTLFPES